MTNRFRMSSSMSPLGLGRPEPFALELGKIAEFYFVFTLASTNINQSAPNFVKIYMTKRSWNEFDYGPNWTHTT